MSFSNLSSFRPQHLQHEGQVPRPGTHVLLGLPLQPRLPGTTEPNTGAPRPTQSLPQTRAELLLAQKVAPSPRRGPEGGQCSQASPAPPVHLIQLGLGRPEVVGHVLLDLGGLPAQRLPELRGLLALCQQRDLRLPFAFILVNFLCKEPEGGCEALVMKPTPPPWVTVFLCMVHPSTSGQVTVLLPGLGGAAQRGLGPPPHVDVQPLVQQENKPGQEEWEGLPLATATTAPMPLTPPQIPPCRTSCQALQDTSWKASLSRAKPCPHRWGEGSG